MHVPCRPAKCTGESEGFSVLVLAICATLARCAGDLHNGQERGWWLKGAQVAYDLAAGLAFVEVRCAHTHNVQDNSTAAGIFGCSCSVDVPLNGLRT